MRRLALLLTALAALGVLALAGCKSKPKPADEAAEEQAAAEPRTVQIEEQRVKVISNPAAVKQEVESTIEAGMKARDRKMVE